MAKPAKCRRCKNPVARDDAVKIGGSRYHEDCANERPKARQVWRNKRWERVKERRVVHE